MIKIVAIDDINDNLITIKALVQEIFPDAKLFTALNGAEGIRLAIDTDPDVILLDILMPDMDGFETCRRMKKNEILKDIPIVFVTALKESKENRIKALEVGAEGFLSKPIDDTELTAQIRAMVKIKAANNQKLSEKLRLSQLVADRTRHLEESNIALKFLMDDLKLENETRKRYEENLRSSEVRYHELFDEIPIGIFQTSPKGEILMANPYLVNLLGFDDFEDLASRDLSKEGFAEGFSYQQFKKEIETNGHVCRSESSWKCKNGKILHVAQTAKVRTDDKGKVLYYEGIVEDITPQKITEAALRESETNFKLLFDKGPLAIAYHRMIYDKDGKPKDYLFLDANKTFIEQTGTNPIGKLVTEAFPGIENDPADWIGQYGKVAKYGKEIRIRQKALTIDKSYDCVAYSQKQDHFVAVFFEIPSRE